MSDPPKVQPIAEVKGTEDAKFDVNNFLIIAGIGIIILTCVSADYTEDGSSGPASKGLWGLWTVGDSAVWNANLRVQKCFKELKEEHS